MVFGLKKIQNKEQNYHSGKLDGNDLVDLFIFHLDKDYSLIEKFTLKKLI